MKESCRAPLRNLQFVQSPKPPEVVVGSILRALRIRTLKNKGFEGTNIYKPLLQRGGVFFFDLTTFPSHMHEAAHEAAIEGHRDSWSNALVKRSVRPSVFFRSAGFSRRTIVLRLCSNTRLFPFYKMVDLTFRVMTSTHVTQVWVDLRKSGE